ncbi:MAG: hypothetical protein QM756_34790 [Polyangiaceae bacterium]
MTLSACSDGGGAAQKVDPAAAAAYCDAIVTRENACGNAPDAAFCNTYVQCIEGVFRPEVVAGLTQCVKTLACTDNDDVCTEQASASNTGAVFASFKTACRARLTACESEFIDDRFFCFEDELGAATDAIIQETQACLDRDCNSIRGCMDAVTAARRCKG